MATVELTKDNFEEVINNNDIVMVDFWADWCAPCKQFAPVYEEVSEKYPDVVFGKVDTQNEQELAAAFQIRSIPTLMLFREQIVLMSESGAFPAGSLEQVIEKAKSLDMDEVRREITEQAEQQQQGEESS